MDLSLDMSVTIRQDIFMQWNRLLFCLPLVFSACSSIEFIDQRKVATQSAEALQSGGRKIEELHSRQEFDQRLLHWLEAHRPENWSAKAPEAKSKLNVFSQHLTSLKSRFDIWRKAVADQTTFAYEHPDVDSRSPIWPETQELTQALVQLNSEFNSELKTTNDSSNELRQLWITNGFYKSQNPQIFGKEIDELSLSWREIYHKRTSDFEVSQARFNQFQTRRPTNFISIDKVMAPLQEMHKNLAKLKDLIERNDHFKISFNHDFMGILEISNIDPDWSQLMNLEKNVAQNRAVFEQKNIDFAESFQEFDLAIASVPENPESANR